MSDTARRQTKGQWQPSFIFKNLRMTQNSEIWRNRLNVNLRMRTTHTPLCSWSRRKEEQRARYQVEKFEKEREAGDEEASALISSLTHADVMDNDRGSPVQRSICGNGLSDGQGASVHRWHLYLGRVGSDWATFEMCVPCWRCRCPFPKEYLNMCIELYKASLLIY